MDKLIFLKKKVLYYLSLIKRECPFCKKACLRENVDEVIMCERCKRKIKFNKLSTLKYLVYYDDMIAKTIMNCNDIITHVRAIKLIKKIKLMNDQERKIETEKICKEADREFGTNFWELEQKERFYLKKME